MSQYYTIHQKKQAEQTYTKVLVKYWFQIFVISIALYSFIKKEISFEFDLGKNVSKQMAQNNQSAIEKISPTAQLSTLNNVNPAMNVSQMSSPKKKEWKDRKANNFYNISFILSPDLGQRKGIDPKVVNMHLSNCYNYVRQYLEIATNERRAYGIPISITLAQGLLESDAGDSRLSIESNNHFGIKCKRKCRSCTCRNYTDDDIYDMFRVFESPWESFREHSILLTGARYKHLLDLDPRDYKGWSRGLKKAGYATDKRYAEKLIQIIEEMQLYRFDEI